MKSARITYNLLEEFLVAQEPTSVSGKCINVHVLPCECRGDKLRPGDEKDTALQQCLCTAMASCPAQSSGHPRVTMIGSRVFGPQEMLAVDRVLPSCTS
ncbi:hypothetical protein B296_00050400 [Ensete ventricosum]|uniref:Uncharacterized protein n=1 Tax=Ensete ventricosum TaxID=4639 RepID=A0A426XBF8_ENSVE|nr:hypothetical protein B296_00050400 [Ensete ventricosum]